MRTLPPSSDIAVVGAGAAGLATAIFVRRFNRTRSVVLARRRAAPGREDPRQRRLALQRHQHRRHRARLLGRPVRRSSAACCARFRSADTIAFFREIGVALHEEARGKLFPDTNRARDVLDALLRETDAAGVTLVAGSSRARRRTDRTDEFRVVTDRRRAARGRGRPRDRRPVAAEERQRRRRLRDGEAARPHDRADHPGARAARPGRAVRSTPSSPACRRTSSSRSGSTARSSSV